MHTTCAAHTPHAQHTHHHIPTCTPHTYPHAHHTHIMCMAHTYTTCTAHTPHMYSMHTCTCAAHTPTCTPHTLTCIAHTHATYVSQTPQAFSSPGIGPKHRQFFCCQPDALPIDLTLDYIYSDTLSLGSACLSGYPSIGFWTISRVIEFYKTQGHCCLTEPLLSARHTTLHLAPRSAWSSAGSQYNPNSLHLLSQAMDTLP